MLQTYIYKLLEASKQSYCQPKPVYCLPYAKNTLDKEQMKEFYATADYQLCRRLGKDFYQEFCDLMFWFTKMTDNPQEKNQIMRFADKIAVPSYFAETNSFYIGIKSGLEEIYYMLRHNYVVEYKKQQLITELSIQFGMCKSGVYSTIMHIRNSMLIPDIYCLVAQYRLEIVLNSSAEFIVDKKINEGNSIHADILFIKNSQNYGFCPFGGEDNLNNDLFENMVPNQEQAKTKLLNDFNENYTVEKIVKYLTNSFFSAIEQLKLDKEITFYEYQCFGDKIGNIYDQHGLADEHGDLQYPEILEHSADSLSFKFSKAAVEYSVAKTLHALGFAEITFDKLKIKEGQLLLASHNGVLMAWKQSNDGKMSYCSDAEAISHKKKQVINKLMFSLCEISRIGRVEKENCKKPKALQRHNSI